MPALHIAALHLVERLVAVTGRLAAWALLPLALLQVAILLARRFGLVAVAPGEIVGWLGVAVALLAVPWALQRRAHVAADVLAERLRPGARRAVERVGLALALLFALALLWLSVPYAWSAYASGEGGGALSGLGLRWVPKAAVPVFAALLALQAAASLLRSLGLPGADDPNPNGPNSRASNFNSHPDHPNAG